MVTLQVNGKEHELDVPDDMPLLVGFTRCRGPDRDEVRLRCCALRCMHRASRWPCDTVLHHAGGERRRQADYDHRSDRRNFERQEDPASLAQRRSGAMRLLPAGPDHVGRSLDREQSQSHPTPRSMRRCRATFAVAAPIRAFAPPSSRHRNRLKESNRHGFATTVSKPNTRPEAFRAGPSC